MPRGTNRDRLVPFASELPEATADFPWGERVAKVNKKVFVFFGADDGRPPVRISLKLAESLEQALAVEGAEPTGYGLGRAGWVTVPVTKGPPVAVLCDWIEESYRIVAPRRLVRVLDGG